MRHSLSFALFWFFVALATVLLAPYVGINIITTPPSSFEPLNSSPASLANDAETHINAVSQDEQLEEHPPQLSPPETLQEIEGLLQE